MRAESGTGKVKKDPGTGFRIFFVSLGCEKNLVDSQQMMGLLEEKGFSLVEDLYDADLAVVNSCCFIGDAKEESINTVIELGELKDEGILKGIILCGCLAQRYADEIEKELPEVDAIVGTTSIDSIAEAAVRVMERCTKSAGSAATEAASSGKTAAGEADSGDESDGSTFVSGKTTSDIRYIASPDRYVYLSGYRKGTGMPYTGYLKIADGCDKRCTYCVIPQVRGRYRSVPMDELVEDAERLAEEGVTELIVVAQETTLYGTDLYGRKALPELLHRLAEIDGIGWIRLMYCYPEEITDELIECIKNEPKICRCLDIPIQHCSDRILKLMGRKTDRASIEAVVERIRKAIPDIAIRTTVISGFPTETEEEHRELLDFVKEMRFERLGDFTYSREEGTRAAEMKGQIPQAVKDRRRAEIMTAQGLAVRSAIEGMYGRVLDVLVMGEDAPHHYVGRAFWDAPDIDAYVYFETKRKMIMSGDFVKVMIEGDNGYDLTGREVENI